MRMHKILALAGILAFAGTACADLDVVNLNAPDRERAISTPGDVEALISGSFVSWWQISQLYYPGAAFGVASDSNTSSWGNFGMRDAGWQPRKEYPNDPAYSYNNVAEWPWTFSYRSLAGIRDGLTAINDGVVITDGAGNDVTQRAVAFGKLVQALSLSNLAMIFDRAFVVDENSDLEALELVPYDQVFDAALQKFAEAIQIAQANDFTIPAEWVGYDSDMTSDYLVQVAKAYRARYRMHLPRTVAERDAVDWNAVLADVQEDLDYDFGGYDDGDNWSWSIIKSYAGGLDGWSGNDMYFMGPADASGGYQEWLATPVDLRNQWLMDTDDRRIQGEDGRESPGLYTAWIGASPWPPDRGTYHFSGYKDTRWDHIWSNNWVGFNPEMTNKELDFIRAEAYYRLNQPELTMEIINKYRVENGQLPAFTDVNGVAPGGERCVPQMPDGSCGDLWEAFKYEKRIELFHYGMATEFFDDRGWGDLVPGTYVHLPIPGSELLLMLMDIYTFGGEAGGAAPSILNDFSPEGLKQKRLALEHFTEQVATRRPNPIQH